MAKKRAVHLLHNTREHTWSLWEPVCDVMGYLRLELTTEPSKTTCKDCLRVIKAKEKTHETRKR